VAVPKNSSQKLCKVFCTFGAEQTLCIINPTIWVKSLQYLYSYFEENEDISTTKSQFPPNQVKASRTICVLGRAGSRLLLEIASG